MSRYSLAFEIRENIDAVVDNSYDWFIKQTPETLWSDMKDCTDIISHPKFNDLEGLKVVKDYLN